MTRQSLLKKKLPDASGVYFFLGKNKKMLYIGRATSLRARVRSYFNGDILESRSPWVARMLPLIKSIDFRKTDSALEAILVEADLIKKFQPPYNTDEKDDKSFNCIAITKEDFPRVLMVRKKNINFSELKIGNCKLVIVYGPFPHGLRLQDALKIIRRIFPYRDQKCIPCSEQPKRQSSYVPTNVGACKPCFNRQIGLCPGVCTGEISKKEYGKTIRNLRMFFEGKKTRLHMVLKKEMRLAAKAQEFEQAGDIKRTIFALQHIQDVALLRNSKFEIRNSLQPFRVEGYDLSHFGGKEIVGAMTVVEGETPGPSEYRLFRIRGISAAHETAGLEEMLRRRFSHKEWAFPELIVVDGNEIQKRATEEMLKELGLSIPIVATVKDERHRPHRLIGDEKIIQERRQAILLANSEAHRFALKFQRKRRGIGDTLRLSNS